MKTKFDIKINAMEINLGEHTITTPEMDLAIELDTTIGELKDLYILEKQVLEESPALIETFFTKIIQATENISKCQEGRINQEKREKNIDAWFTEYFLAPNVTDEAKKQFDTYFNNTVARCDFFNLGYEKKDAFFTHICNTCF